MKFVNLTPHDINIVGQNNPVTIPASGKEARITTTQVPVGTLVVGSCCDSPHDSPTNYFFCQRCGEHINFGTKVLLSSTSFGGIEGLPAKSSDCALCGLPADHDNHSIPIKEGEEDYYHYDKCPYDEYIYIVSALVASRVPDRDDVLSPGDLVRDRHGNVIGCRGLTRHMAEEVN